LRFLTVFFFVVAGLLAQACSSFRCGPDSCPRGCCWANACYEGGPQEGGGVCLEPPKAEPGTDGSTSETSDASFSDASVMPGGTDGGRDAGTSSCLAETTPCNGSSSPCCARTASGAAGLQCVSERCRSCQLEGQECDAIGKTTVCCGALRCALKPGFQSISACQVDDGGLRFDPNIDCVGEATSCLTKRCCTHTDAGVALTCNDYRCQRVDCVTYGGFCVDGLTPPCCDVQSSSESRTCFQTRCERCYRKGALCWNTGTDYPCCSGAPCPGPSGGYGYCP
jgi:hypothetical protein